MFAHMPIHICRHKVLSHCVYLPSDSAMSKFAKEESDREEDKSLPRGEEAELEPGVATP